MKSPIEFRNEVLGKKFDVDGYYGSQCWDGYAYYMKWLGYAYANCTTSGYVKDIWNNRANNGMLNTCDVVSSLQQGDITVFTEAPQTPYSHIAIFIADNGNGTGIFLGENQGGSQGSYNEMTFSYAGILGSFRPKVYKDLFAKPVASLRWKVGTPVCTNTIASSSGGGNIYKGDWEGTITKVIPGATYPYLINNGAVGWANDEGIDSDPHVPGSKRKSLDQIALEIYRGLGNWGNGQERFKKLKAAGYNADEVQKKINALF